jgi:HEAT repeat protein
VAVFAHRNADPFFHGRLLSSLIEDLAEADYQTRDDAAEAIQSMGADAVPLLIDALQTHETPLTKPLLAVGQKLPFLHLKQTDASLRRANAAEQLGAIGVKSDQTIPALIAALREGDRVVLAEIQRALRRCGPADVPLLARALAHRDARVRGRTAEVLQDLGAQGAAAVPALMQALSDRDDAVRYRAAQALGACGGSEPFVVCRLTAALNDRAPIVRCAAAASLGKLGFDAKSSIPVLEKALYDRDTGVRVAAARSLWILDGNPERVVPVLIAALKDQVVGWQAPFVLGEMGAKANEAVPALIEALKQERVPRPLRTPPSAALALGQIGPAAVPGLIATLHDAQPSVRTGAAIALGFMGISAQAAVPALITLLNDKELEVRQASALSLGAIGPATRELLPALKELARDEDIFVSNAAVTALRKIDPAAAAEIGVE